MRFFTPLFLLVSAGLSLANNLPNVTTPQLPASIPTADPIKLLEELSPQCQGALFGIVTSPEFLTCVPVVALLPLLTDPTLLPSVLQDPLQNAPKLLPVVEAICDAPKCKDNDVQQTLKTVVTECSADLNNPLIQLLTAVLTFYSPGRDILCFKDNKDVFCTVETVTNILTLPDPPKDFHLLGGIIDKVIVAEPKSICTPCNKAILNTVVNFLKANPQALQILEQAFNLGEEELVIGKIFVFLKCGFEFLDGKVPDPSKIDPSKFTYQTTDSDDKVTASLATHNEQLSLLMIGSLLASTFVLN